MVHEGGAVALAEVGVAATVETKGAAAGGASAEVDAVAGAKAAAEKEAGLHKAIAALSRIEDAERQLRAARAARRAKAKEKAADSLCATRS